MNKYVILAYLTTFILIIGELVFTFSNYKKSTRILEEIKENNEKKT